jgi:hypothetical protein
MTKELSLEFLGAKSDAAFKHPDITVNALHDQGILLHPHCHQEKWHAQEGCHTFSM